MNAKLPASLSTTLADSMVETRRRQRATVTGGESTLDDDSGYVREFRTDDQKVCLWNLANAELHPRALFPAFRILGLFPDTATALAHAQLVIANDPVCALRMVETHGWYTIPIRDDPGVDLVAKVNRNLLRHQAMLQDHATEFTQRHDALTAGRTPAIRQAQAAVEQAERDERQRERRKAIYTAALDQDDETVTQLKARFEREMADDAETEVRAQVALQLVDGGATECKASAEVGSYTEPKLVAPIAPEKMNDGWQAKMEHLAGGAPPALSRLVEVRNQRYAVVSVVTDYDTCSVSNPMGSEPGVIVWAAFDTEAEALRYNKCIASKKVRDHDLAIVTMYEWLYPHMMSSDGVEQLYRNTELDAIMRHTRTASKQVHDFEEMCAREEIAVPTVEIEPDLTTAVPHTYTLPTGAAL